MSKLSLEALKQRAEAVTTEELMTQIGGGTENACHPGSENTVELTGNLETDSRNLDKAYPPAPQPTVGNVNPYRK